MSGDVGANWNSLASIISSNAAHLSSVDFYGRNDMYAFLVFYADLSSDRGGNQYCRDMMEIGNGQLTIEEQRSHFAAWVFMKSPILLGTDVSSKMR